MGARQTWAARPVVLRRSCSLSRSADSAACRTVSSLTAVKLAALSEKSTEQVHSRTHCLRTHRDMPLSAAGLHGAAVVAGQCVLQGLEGQASSQEGAGALCVSTFEAGDLGYKHQLHGPALPRVAAYVLVRGDAAGALANGHVPEEDAPMLIRLAHRRPLHLQLRQLAAIPTCQIAASISDQHLATLPAKTHALCD